MNKQLSIAIVIVAYNRADSVQRLLKSLSKAHYSQEVPLIISIDKSDTDSVEQFADSFQWMFGPKIIDKHNENLGLRRHILSIGEYTEKYDAVIVLEDDLEVSPCFYDYALATLNKYNNIPEVAGISLYSFPFNNYLSLPFHPSTDEYDAYMMQIAQSWGQIWMKKQWADFAKWYKNHNEEFDVLPHLPLNICKWGKKSWLKYHNKYCIETNKFFIYPYVSLTTNSGAAGTHSSVSTNITQTILQEGRKFEYHLPDFDDATKYDGYYESLDLKKHIDAGVDVCIDLYGLKKNALKNRYWLTTEKEDFKIIKSYGFNHYPIEDNVKREVKGNNIYLYDTTVNHRNPFSDNSFELLNYHFKIRGIYSLMKRKGFIKIIFKTIKVILTKKI